MIKLYSIVGISLLSLSAFAQCSFRSASQATGNSTGVTVNIPAGTQPGDVMIAAIHVGWCNSGSSISAPLGWTLIAETSNTGSGCGSSNTTKQLATFYKVATNIEPPNYTFTGTTNQFYVGGILSYSGVNITTPINVFSNNGAQDACAALTATSVTTTVTNSTLVGVFFCSVNNSLNNIVPPNSMTERVDVGTTGNHPWGNENLEMADQSLSSMGATGNRVAGLSGCSSTGWVTGAQLIALSCGPTIGINETILENISIHPNPSNGNFEISFENSSFKSAEIEILDYTGKSIFKHTGACQPLKISMGNKAKGIYFVRLSSDSFIETRKIVIE